MAMVNLTINGINVSVPAGTTVLEAARSAGIHIPTLCFLKEQDPKANCRICLVEIQRMKALQPSCATRVSEGMVVLTDTDRVKAARKTNLELLLAHHPMDCQHCARNGVCEVVDLSDEMCKYCIACDCIQSDNCELQTLAREMNAACGDFSWEDKALELDKSTPAIVKDPNKCILCGRCVETCGTAGQELYIWSRTGRSHSSKISAGIGESLADSGCIQCGRCVKNCPTGALSFSRDTDDLSVYLDDSSRKTKIMVEPGFFKEFTEINDYKDIDVTMDRLVKGFRKIGVDEIVTADAAVKAEWDGLAAEALASEKPVIASDCYAVTEYINSRFPDLAEMMSATKSAGRIWADTEREADPSVYTIRLSAAGSDKAESAANGAGRDNEIVFTPLEIRRLFRKSAVELGRFPLEAEKKSAGSYALLPAVCDITEKTVSTGSGSITVVTAQGMKAVREVLRQVREGNCSADLIQLAAVPGERVDLTSVAAK